MDSSNAEQLTDAAAEAVLLALGPQLEWTKINGSEFYQVADVSIGEERRRYSLSSSRHGCYVAVLSNVEVSGSSTAPPSFGSVAEAKAGCERHHATGKWD